MHNVAQSVGIEVVMSAAAARISATQIDTGCNALTCGLCALESSSYFILFSSPGSPS